MHIVLLLVSTMIAMISCKLEFDASLENACQQMGATMKKREGPNAIVGDTCSLKFRVSTRDDDDARDFCELYAPWRLQKVERIEDSEQFFTICHVEATLMCEDGWHQMFGHCFKMPNKAKIATLEEAKDMCDVAKNGSEIAFLHHKYISGVWKRFFVGVGQIWVRATESWDQYIQKTNTIDGDALALAFTGKHFDFAVPADSLIKIDPKMRLQVLCQYKPPITNAEINHLGKRYSEIYYPSVTVDHGILVRSASSYTSSADNMDICEKTLKPYMFKPIGPFVPELELLSQIGETSLPQLYLTRSGAEARLDRSKQVIEGCQPVTSRFSVKVPSLSVGDALVKHFNDLIPCDNMKSTAILHFNNEAKLTLMSESRSLPIWCKLGRTAVFSYTTPPGYTAFERENGDVVAHRLYTDKVVYEEADKRCRKDGALLSGINSLKEANALGALAVKSGQNNLQYWLGGKRIDDCLDVNGFSTEPEDKCYRNKVIDWQDDVATEFFDDWWRDGPTHKNPSSNKNSHQPCLTYVHGSPSWADKDTKRFLDDTECDWKRGFFCVKKIDIVKEEIVID